MQSIAGDFILQQDNPSCQNFFIIFYDRVDFTVFKEKSYMGLSIINLR